MGKYARAVLLAVKYIEIGQVSNPIDAWEKASIDVFGEETPSQVKGCPRNTFLVLCEKGMVKRVKPGAYTKSAKNKGYALKAVNLLKSNPSLGMDSDMMWKEVQDGENKVHNAQMDVVTALWNKGLIVSIVIQNGFM